MIPAVFIGGPLDGQLIALEEYELDGISAPVPPVYEAEWIKKEDSLDNIRPGMPVGVIQVIQYVPTEWPTGHVTYSPRWMYPKEIMQALLSRYVRAKE